MRITALVLFLAFISLGSTDPTFSQAKLDCTNPQTQADMNLCAGEDFKAAAAELNAAWAALRDARQDDGSWQAILDAQRLWIPFRDAHCAAVAAPYEGGSIQPLIRASCLAVITEQRHQQLHDLLIQP